MPSPTRVAEILLVPHTHHDIGYTDTPRLVDRQHRDIVRRVLDLCDETADAGPEALRWTFEISRPVLQFVRHGLASDLDRLRRQVASGRIAVTGGYANMTQLPGEQEIERSYEALAPLADAGIRIRTQQHGDVNGLSWGSVPAMRRHGITRLVMALNPDHGRPPFTQPSGFWWRGPDGERIFVFLSTHYGYGEEWGIIDGDVELAAKRITELVDGLDRRADYPFDVAVVHAANDNRWPTLEFLPLLRHWNAIHPDRPMRLATMDEAVDRLEAQAADHADLPEVTGEWADWWAHGHGSTAFELAVYREARRHLLTGEALHALAALRGDGAADLASVLGHSRGPVRLRTRGELDDDVREVEHLLWLFAEHTWGSWESFSNPSSVYTASHWNAKAGFAYAAYDHARQLAVEGLFRLLASGDAHPGEPAMVRTGPGTDRTCPGGGFIVLVNPTGRHRSEPVVVEVTGGGTVAVPADLPPFGVGVVAVPDVQAAEVNASTAETARYRATVDPRRGGVVSLVDQRTGRELVDAGAGHGLGAIVSEVVTEGSAHPFVTRSAKDFSPEFPGPEFDRLGAASDEPARLTTTATGATLSWTSSVGALRAESALRLYEASDVIDLDITLTKGEVFTSESIFAAFPFAVAQPRFLVETAGAVFTADDEQLPDTSRDWYAVQHAVGVTAGAAAEGTGGILWGSYDAPLVQLGGIQTGKWAPSLEAPAGHINSWLMNNLHFTNFRAAQGGTQTFRYRFMLCQPESSPDRSMVRRFGDDLLRPVVTRQYSGPVVPAGAAGLLIEPADDLLVDLRPAPDGTERVEVVARLRSTATEPRTVTLRWPTAGEVEAMVAGADAGWRPLGPEQGIEVTVPPLGVADLRLRR